MSDPSPEISVGSVVARGRDVGVVLDIRGDSLLVAPIKSDAAPGRAGDVALDVLADLAVARAVYGAVIRLSVQNVVARTDQRYLGELSEAAMGCVDQVRARLELDAAAQARWGAARATYREHLVGERAVKL